eukprot:XP_001708399.1 Hypothetical protein GL50803_10124 [Giardia lamblia ATCC 50803]
MVNPYLLLVDHSAPLLRHYVISHPTRDHVDAHPMQCVWLSDDVVCISLHRTAHLEVMLWSAETVGPSPHLFERRRKASSGSIRNDPKT